MPVYIVSGHFVDFSRNWDSVGTSEGKAMETGSAAVLVLSSAIVRSGSKRREFGNFFSGGNNYVAVSSICSDFGNHFFEREKYFITGIYGSPIRHRVVLITVSAAEAEMGGSVKGVLTMLCCACLVAVQTVTVHHLSDEFSSIEITCIMNVTAAVCFDAYAVFSLRERIWDELFVPFGSSEGLLPIVYLGLGCSVGAFFCLNYINSHLDVVRAAVFINLSTIVSVLAGVLIGGDRLNAGQTAGILMILIGVWGVNAFQPSGQKTLICHRNDRGDQ